MHGSIQPSAQPIVIGRYAIYDAIASGGMATVHLGRLVGPAGFSRTVAVKRLHAQLAQDPEISQMLLDEARLAARVQHPNVVPTLDVVAAGNEMLLVMEYVRGDSLSRIVRAAQQMNVRLPANVAVAIMLNTLAGLHAAHEATDERGEPLGLVHRDVSPQNVMVGVDGVARVLDFGIAKAEGRLVTTREGEVKGKVMYMAREQLAGENVTRGADIYAAGIILYEMLTGVRMFAGENEVAAVTRIVANDLRMPSQTDPSLAAFDPIIRRASALFPHDRYPTARDMARDIEALCAPASATVVGEWVQRLATERLDIRARLVAEIERSTTRSRAAFAQVEGTFPGFGSNPPHIQEQQPTSGVIATSRGRATPSSFTGPMQMVQMSAPPPPVEEKSGFGAVGVIALIAFLLLGGVGVGGIVMSRRAASAKPLPTFSEPVPVAPTVTAEEAKPEEPKAEEPSAPAAAASSGIRATTPVPPRPKAKPKCDPPYTLDAKGHKHFIPECIGQ